MIYMFTGLPGASKTLNTVSFCVGSYEPSSFERENYYCNIRNFVLDWDFLSSFSGWFYCSYLPTIKDSKKLKKLNKIIASIHQDDRNVDSSDFPHLLNMYESFNHFDTFDYWVRRLYSKKQLSSYFDLYDLLRDSDDLDFESFRHLNLHWNYFEDPFSWHHLPKKSRILIDEIQEFFPPRSAGSKKPDAIAALEKHRHKGFDLFFITQDGMLVDVNIRRLVGRHTHFFNYMGGKRLVKIVGSKYFDPSDYHQVNALEKTRIKHPVQFYGSYYSAEIHTHKFKVPKFVYYFVLGFLILGFAIYLGWSTLSGLSGSDDSQFVSSQSASVSYGQQSSVSSFPVVSVPQPSSFSNGPDPMHDYLDGILKTVVITGHSMRKKGSSVFHQYAFVDKETDRTFEPFNIGLKVFPLSECSAKVVLDSYSYFLTCDPFVDRYEHDTEEEVDFSSNRFASR